MDHCNEKRITYLKYGFISIYVMHSTYFGRVVVKVETLFQTH